MIHNIILLILFAFGLIFSIKEYFSKKAVEGKDTDYRKLFRKLQIYRGILFFLCILSVLKHLFPALEWL